MTMDHLFGVDQLADGTPIGLWFVPGIVEHDELDRIILGEGGLKELQSLINEALGDS